MACVKSKGLYLLGAHEFQAEERSVLPPAADEVQIAVRSTTLCGSDLHYYQKGCNGSIQVREPLCLGHESAGEVVAVGGAVQQPRVGDRVAIECGIPCGECELCKAQRYNLCETLRFRGSGSAWPHFQGTMQTRINHPARWTHTLPEELSFEEGALLEPLAVALHACRRAAIQPDSTCTIIGAGAIGLLCAIAARNAGCRKIAIADIVGSRVAFALDKGFADVGLVVEGKRAASVSESLELAKNTAASIAALDVGGGAKLGATDYTLECTGVESCVQTAVFTTKRGGKAVLVGMGTPNLSLPISVASAREIDIIPTWRYANCYETAVRLVTESKKCKRPPQVAEMITHRFNGVGSVAEALQTAGLGKDADGQMVVKVVLNNDD